MNLSFALSATLDSSWYFRFQSILLMLKFALAFTVPLSRLTAAGKVMFFVTPLKVKLPESARFGAQFSPQVDFAVKCHEIKGVFVLSTGRRGRRRHQRRRLWHLQLAHGCCMFAR